MARPQCDIPIVFSSMCFISVYTCFRIFFYEWLQFIPIYFESCFSISCTFFLLFMMKTHFQFFKLTIIAYRLDNTLSSFQIDAFWSMCLHKNLHLHRVLCKLHNNFRCYKFIWHDRFLIFKDSLVVADFYRGWDWVLMFYSIVS
jgi:hypothetical protein